MRVRLVLSAVVLVCFCQPSFAAGRDFCQRYASNAVQAQLGNIRHRCGFYGRRWSTDYGDHFGWCLRAPVDAADHEEDARRRMLRNCR